jgi:hypothetical protein
MANKWQRANLLRAKAERSDRFRCLYEKDFMASPDELFVSLVTVDFEI